MLVNRHVYTKGRFGLSFQNELIGKIRAVLKETLRISSFVILRSSIRLLNNKYIRNSCCVQGSIQSFIICKRWTSKLHTIVLSPAQKESRSRPNENRDYVENFSDHLFAEKDNEA